MVRFRVAILALLVLIAQSLAEPHQHIELPPTTTVGIVSRAPRNAGNAPRFLQLRRGCTHPFPTRLAATRVHLATALRGFFFFFFTLVTGPRRSLSLKLSDTRAYEPQMRARLSTWILPTAARIHAAALKHSVDWTHR